MWARKWLINKGSHEKVWKKKNELTKSYNAIVYNTISILSDVFLRLKRDGKFK